MKISRKLLSFALLLTFLMALFPVGAFAGYEGDVVAQPTMGYSNLNSTPNNITSLSSSNVALVTITSSTSSAGSSFSVDGHAWITVKNVSSSNITVGKLSQIAPNKSVTIGTWGNKSEHTGIWYNLEPYIKTQLDSDAYSTRASLSMYVDSEGLTDVTNYIKNNDTWTTTHNCTSFAMGLWNSISSTTLSNGTFNTPLALYNSIKAQSGYTTNSPISWDYVVYYAQGTDTPIKSEEWN